MVSCKTYGSIYLHAGWFDDRYGIHVSNQWYSSISIKGKHESVFENKKALQTKKYEHCIAFPKNSNGEHLYLILKSNWQYHNQYDIFRLQSLDNAIFNENNI